MELLMMQTMGISFAVLVVSLLGTQNEDLRELSAFLFRASGIVFVVSTLVLVAGRF